MAKPIISEQIPQYAEVTPIPDLKNLKMELLRHVKLIQEYADTLPDPPSSAHEPCA